MNAHINMDVNIMNNKKLITAFSILFILDFLTTAIGIRYFGAVEINPIFNVIGFEGFMTLKLVVSIFTISVLWKIKTPTTWVWIPAVVCYTVVVISNLYQLCKVF